MTRVVYRAVSNLSISTKGEAENLYMKMVHTFGVNKWPYWHFETKCSATRAPGPHLIFCLMMGYLVSNISDREEYIGSTRQQTGIIG
jgi:hypothetical protein